ncbi:MAG: spore cortex-lytic protein [Ruminococcaceae bacterium]|nr:spore cortex-lytic protein [Oscillospiraceae bacterium]
MPYPVIPEQITVHLGAPSQSAPNVTLPFADYIKNVASSEIYPTWPESAIRANILAQISYALNRVYTEHYPARGYDFDVTNTTQYDQAFVEGREIFENISRIVDDIFNDYIVRQGSIEPLFAQFCDGRQSTCEGLSQWGTVDLAEEGYTPYQILQYYYGGDINIVFNAPVGGGVPSYPGRPLSRGSVGEDVRTLQRQLNRIGKNYPAIGQIPEVNGIFDRTTEEAVRVFQQVFNLAVDGVVGKATWYQIKRIYQGVKRLSELTSEGLTIAEAQRQYPRLLQFGDSGTGVRTVRYYLAFLGFFLPQLPQLEVTDQFDQQMLDAVYAFQNYAGITPDGLVGRDTWNRLQETYRQVLDQLPAEYREFAGELYPGRFVVLGDSGEQVRLLQSRLNAIARQEGWPTVEEDGVFGPATQGAVRQLQRQLGQDATGVVGPLLWSQIMTMGAGY